MSEIRGLGLDMCAIARMQELLDSHRSLRRLFSEAEEAYIRSKGVGAAQTMAGLFAAKEAVLKALGVGLTVPLADVIITHTELGQPLVTLTGKAAQLGGSFLLTITHEENTAAAAAIWLA